MNFYTLQILKFYKKYLAENAKAQVHVQMQREEKKYDFFQ